MEKEYDSITYGSFSVNDNGAPKMFKTHASQGLFRRDMADINWEGLSNCCWGAWTSVGEFVPLARFCYRTNVPFEPMEERTKKFEVPLQYGLIIVDSKGSNTFMETFSNEKSFKNAILINIDEGMVFTHSQWGVQTPSGVLIPFIFQKEIVPPAPAQVAKKVENDIDVAVRVRNARINHIRKMLITNCASSYLVRTDVKDRLREFFNSWFDKMGTEIDYSEELVYRVDSKYTYFKTKASPYANTFFNDTFLLFRIKHDKYKCTEDAVIVNWSKHQALILHMGFERVQISLSEGMWDDESVPLQKLDEYDRAVLQFIDEFMAFNLD